MKTKEIYTETEPRVDHVDGMTLDVTMTDGSKWQLKYSFNNKYLEHMDIYMDYGFKDERINFGYTKVEFPWSSYTLDILEIDK